MAKLAFVFPGQGAQKAGMGKSLYEADPAAKFEVDLDKQTFTICATGETAAFEIDGYKKECLLNGYDDVDYLLSIRPEIDRFEAEKN